MEGDLSLSQTLGGLRIANNPSPAPRSLSSSASSSKSSLSDREEQGVNPYDTEDLKTPTQETVRRLGEGGVEQSQQVEPYTSPSVGGPAEQQYHHHQQHQQQQQHTTDLRHQNSTSRRQDASTGPPFSVSPRSSSRQAFPPGPPPPGPIGLNQNSRPNSQYTQPYGGPQRETPPFYPDYNRVSREPSRSSLHGPPGATRPTRERPVPADRTYRQSAPIGHYPPPPPQQQGPPRGVNRMSNQPGMPVPSQMAQQNGSPYIMENGPPASSEEWKDKGAAVTVRNEIDENGNTVQRVHKKGVRDFQFKGTLGEGSYSTVHLAMDRTTGRDYAIKVLDKRHIIKENKVKYVTIEKDTLNRLGNHPGIVRLYYTFQDERSLYFVLDLASNGELLGLLKQYKTFNEECTRYYGAQILDAIEYMHSRNIIHRDLKPENVLLDENMHVKITDFGTAKILSAPRQNGGGLDDPGRMMDGMNVEDRANSFVGTAEYVSPELLVHKSACKASDLWAFGCIIYQLLTGRPPFKAGNEYLTFQKIVGLEYDFPRGFPPVARDLVERLLVLDPAKRLTIEHIRNHPFFEGQRWGPDLWRETPPRLAPYIPASEASKPINLGGSRPAPQPLNSAAPPSIPRSNNNSSSQTSGQPRPQPPPRVITELPPPSQLDIEWSPVLSHPNERILKVGNATVTTSPPSSSPPLSSTNGHLTTSTSGKSAKNGSTSTLNSSHSSTLPSHSKTESFGGGATSKFSRFFSGTKKRQRTVMITSAGRIILANQDKHSRTESAVAATKGKKGDEDEEEGGRRRGGWGERGDKKVKGEINLLAKGVVVRLAQGTGMWVVETKDKRYTFEDPKTPAQDYIDATLLAQSFGSLTQSHQPGLHSSASSPNLVSSTLSSPASTINTKHSSGDLLGGGKSAGEELELTDDTGEKKRKNRFSRRGSRHGLAGIGTVF